MLVLWSSALIDWPPCSWPYPFEPIGIGMERPTTSEKLLRTGGGGVTLTVCRLPFAMHGEGEGQMGNHHFGLCQRSH
jgi:hypothetical protein